MPVLNDPYTQMPTRVLQFGGGNFIRGFVDWMIDILNQETDFNGGVLIIKPTNNGDYNLLKNQNGRFHILTRGISQDQIISDSHYVQCINRIIHPYNEWSEFLSTSKISEIRFIISNTTESGIRYKEENFNSSQCPEEFPAKLTHWLYARWRHFKGTEDKGCIFLPTELIEQNATALQDCILQHIDNWNLENDFKHWVLQNNHFYNTLVDRIVPGYPREIELQEDVKDDPLLVMVEPYHLWAIEAPIKITEEIPFDQTKLNVVFTEDLKQYREMKIRILNGAHTAMVPIGYLAGLDTVLDTINDEQIGVFVQKLIYEEILPTLTYPIEEKEKYASDVLDRLRNPNIKHNLLSISLNSIAKFKHRLLPSLIDYQRITGPLPERIVASLAALIIFYRGKRKDQIIPLKDTPSNLENLESLWAKWEDDKNTKSLADKVLSNCKFWDRDLRTIAGLSDRLTAKINQQMFSIMQNINLKSEQL